MDEAMQPVRLMHPIPEATWMTGLSRSAFFEKLASGEIESVKIGRRRLIPHAALEAYVEGLRAAS